MIQTIALEDISSPNLNPDFNPHVSFFDSARGKQAKEFAKKRLERYKEMENFSKTITFRLMRAFEAKLKPNCALIISHHKLGKSPVTAILMGVTAEKGGKTIKVKARIKL